MKRGAILFALSLFAVTLLYPQESVPTADEIMKKAITQAKKENKSIILMFHASWCGWCKRMDASLTDDSCSDYFDKNFVITHMTVKESQANKHLENPGADELLSKYKAEKSGIPFWLIFNNNGEYIADSFTEPGNPGSNIGCPAREDEVAAFITKLKMAATMTADQETRITKRFKQNAN